MLHAVQHVNGAVLWANLHLLFWLSLVPFVTGWMGENHFAPRPVAVYGFVLIMAAAAYTILQTTLLALDGNESPLARAVGPRLERQAVARAIRDGNCAVVCVELGISCALFHRRNDLFIPDKRIERVITH